MRRSCQEYETMFSTDCVFGVRMYLSSDNLKRIKKVFNYLSFQWIKKWLHCACLNHYGFSFDREWDLLRGLVSTGMEQCGRVDSGVFLLLKGSQIWILKAHISDRDVTFVALWLSRSPSLDPAEWKHVPLEGVTSTKPTRTVPPVETRQ